MVVFKPGQIESTRLLPCRFKPAMVEEVVRNILAELQRTPLYLPLDLVGMDNRVQGALDHLQTNDGSQAVKVIATQRVMHSSC